MKHVTVRLVGGMLDSAGEPTSVEGALVAASEPATKIETHHPEVGEFPELANHRTRVRGIW